MRYIKILVIILTLFAVSARTASAVNDPPLFTCNLPVGDQIANTNGTHGIAGDMGTYTGNDVVYKVDSDHVLQCFCPDNSIDGIQSNWTKATNLSDSERDFFIRRGWVLISNGQPWGLDADPYLVKNDGIRCADLGGVVGASTSNSNGEVLGASTLADTGTQKAIVISFGLSLVFAATAYKISRQ